MYTLKLLFMKVMKLHSFNFIYFNIDVNNEKFVEGNVIQIFYIITYLL